jgi:hypothetical protein
MVTDAERRAVLPEVADLVHEAYQRGRCDGFILGKIEGLKLADELRAAWAETKVVSMALPFLDEAEASAAIDLSGGVRTVCVTKEKTK